jgi:NurA-like 5'-3' nuclease
VEVLALMDAVVAAIVAALLSGFSGYLWGNRRLKYERLYGQRAEVLSTLGKLLYRVQRGFVDFTSLSKSGEPSEARKEQLEEANRAFFELVHYFYANEMWLEEDTCLKIEKFTQFAYLKMGEYVDDLNERGYPQSAEGLEIGNRIKSEIQPLRRELINEFRAIVYPAPFYESALSTLGARTKRDS